MRYFAVIRNCAAWAMVTLAAVTLPVQGQQIRMQVHGAIYTPTLSPTAVHAANIALNSSPANQYTVHATPISIDRVVVNITYH
ncbi:MAG: hypothetical protein E6Q48_03485 [Limnohabitans sp.]|nr:MAG: hypothetical protein E6Q48_03485 [Limnohabitans sp.]